LPALIRLALTTAEVAAQGMLVRGQPAEMAPRPAGLMLQQVVTRLPTLLLARPAAEEMQMWPSASSGLKQGVTAASLQVLDKPLW
jgi:hypothetical protein